MCFGGEGGAEDTLENAERSVQVPGSKFVGFVEKKHSIHGYHRGGGVAENCWFGCIWSQEIPENSRLSVSDVCREV